MIDPNKSFIIRRIDNEFRGFRFDIVGRGEIMVWTPDKMEKQAREIADEVTQNHSQLKLFFPLYSLKQPEVVQFIKELSKQATVVFDPHENRYCVTPKYEEEVREFLIRKYSNGVEETVKAQKGDDWNGIRRYPDGKIEEGDFSSFGFFSGKRQVGQKVTYVRAAKIGRSAKYKCIISAQQVDGQERLLILRQNPGSSPSDCETIAVEEELFPILVDILIDKTDYLGAAEIQKMFNYLPNSRDFAHYLIESGSIFHIMPERILAIFTVLESMGIEIDLDARDPQTNRPLFENYLGNRDLMNFFAARDPVFYSRLYDGETVLEMALFHPTVKCKLHPHLYEMQEHGVQLSPWDEICLRVVQGHKVSFEELQALTPNEQQKIYWLANKYSKINVLSHLRKLGFVRQEALLVRDSPAILAHNMDALEMRDVTLKFLQDLRSENLFLTRAEFEQLKQENPGMQFWEKQADISRIFGRNYHERINEELELDQVKLPTKWIVIEDESDIVLTIDRNLEIVCKSHNLTIYAQEIPNERRAISLEQSSQLLCSLLATNYNDFRWDNGHKAADGSTYLIDTEFKNYRFAEISLSLLGNVAQALPKELQSQCLQEIHAVKREYEKNKKYLRKMAKLDAREEERALQKTGCHLGVTLSFTQKELLQG